METLLDTIKNKSARVGVIGLGYVGVPLAIRISEQGLPVLGFINPRLYQKSPGSTAFFDVTSGNTKTTCAHGFGATEGFDLATGFGSPRWAGLLDIFGSD